MKYKTIIYLLFFVQTCTALYGQHNFDSIKICHAKGFLKSVTIGEYEVKLAKGLLQSISSNDNTVRYEVSSKLFVIKNLHHGSFLKMQLVDEGIIINARDTSFIINTPKSINLMGTNNEDETEALYSIGDFSFLLEFNKGKLIKVRIPTTGKYILVNLIQINGVYSWDFSIESTEYQNSVVLTNVFNKPYLLSIRDDKNKVGVRLFAKKKDGVFIELIGQKIYKNNSFSSDKAYKLQYSNSGKLKKRNTSFKLTCEE